MNTKQATIPTEMIVERNPHIALSHAKLELCAFGIEVQYGYPTPNGFYCGHIEYISFREYPELTNLINSDSTWNETEVATLVTPYPSENRSAAKQ